MINKWANTQTIREVKCPHCGANTNQSCQTPKGKKADVHCERLVSYRLLIGKDEFRRRHTGYPGKVWDADI